MIKRFLNLIFSLAAIVFFLYFIANSVYCEFVVDHCGELRLVDFGTWHDFHLFFD